MKYILVLFLFIGLYNLSSSQSININSLSSWNISSVPKKQISLFPEGNLINNRAAGYNRSRINWFTIDPIFFRHTSVTPSHISEDTVQLKNHLSREVFEREIYPNCNDNIPSYIPTFNICYYPEEKGPYNYDVDSTIYSKGIDLTGKLNAPETRWGGIMRSLESHFLASHNIHYIGFWLMDPFVYNSNLSGGDFYIQIGEISEDILYDNKVSSESSFNFSYCDTTAWGLTGSQLIFPYTFYNTGLYDPGLDELDDPSELSFFNNYLYAVKNIFGINSVAYKNAQKDPSSDNFDYYLGSHHDDSETSILSRYKNYNNTQGNTNIAYSDLAQQAGTSMPNCEDINRNKLLDIDENFFQYKISIRPEDLIVGQNFIAEKITVNPENGDGTAVSWYKFLVPLEDNSREKIGNITTLDSSKFIRLILKNFSDSIILRTYLLSLVHADLNEPINALNIFAIYPNPTSGKINITNNNEIMGFKIIDLLGRIIYQNTLSYPSSELDLDLSFLNNGVYTIVLETSISWQSKIIIIQK